MTFEELLINRRSIRNYQDNAVPMEIINEIIEESTLAPSSGNSQPWRFIIITNRDLLDRISAESKTNMLTRIANNPNDHAKKYEKMLSNESYKVLFNAPALVYILGKADLKNLYADCALAASYFMMSACSKGLGTCWINFANQLSDETLKEIGVPEGYKTVAPIILGYPEKIPAAPSRMEPQILNIIK